MIIAQWAFAHVFTLTKWGILLTGRWRKSQVTIIQKFNKRSPFVCVIKFGWGWWITNYSWGQHATPMFGHSIVCILTDGSHWGLRGVAFATTGRGVRPLQSFFRRVAFSAKAALVLVLHTASLTSSAGLSLLLVKSCMGSTINFCN